MGLITTAKDFSMPLVGDEALSLGQVGLQKKKTLQQSTP